MNAGYSKLGCSALLQCMHCLPLAGRCTGGTDLARLYCFNSKDIGTKARICSSVSLLPNLFLLYSFLLLRLLLAWSELKRRSQLLAEFVGMRVTPKFHYCKWKSSAISSSGAGSITATQCRNPAKRKEKTPVLLNYINCVPKIKVLGPVRMLLDTPQYQAGSQTNARMDEFCCLIWKTQQRP